MCMSGSMPSNLGPSPSEIRAREQAQKVAQGTTQINDYFDNTFTPDFYQERRTAFMDNYQPQAEQQYNEARQKLAYDFARKGMSNTSAAASLYGDLSQEYERNKQDLVDQQNQYIQGLKGQVSDARKQGLTMVNTTFDPNASYNAALNQVEGALAEPMFPRLSSSYSAMGGAIGSALGSLGSLASSASKRTTGSGGNIYDPYATNRNPYYVIG